MSIGARGHPADDLAVVPDGLVAECVRIGRIHFEADEPQRTAALLLLRGSRTANEVILLEVDEPAETGLERPVNGSILAGPGTKALFDAHGIERPAAEGAQAKL